MDLLVANSGSYPRVGSEPGQLRLRKSYQKWEKNDISDEDLEEVYQDYTADVIEEQEEAGLDVVTDGQLRWYDPFSHFAKRIEGCEINGLLRYFDTNFYFRQPVIVDDLKWNEPTVKSEFLSAREMSTKTVKPVITGPYTLAKYSIDKHYGDITELVRSFTEVISRELKDLVEAGAREIQVDEPGILKNEEDYDIFAEAMGNLAEVKGDSQLDLYFYFDDATPLYERLQDLPVDLLGLDFTYSPKLPDLIRDRGSEKALGLGLIDARNTKMEREEEIVSLLEEMAPEIDSDKIYLNPSCGLEFLPRKRAIEKMNKMVQIAETAEEVI